MEGITELIGNAQTILQSVIAVVLTGVTFFLGVSLVKAIRRAK